MYCLRTINPVPHQEVWQDFDAIIREALCKILGVSLIQQQWIQATLPIAVGGLGLRGASDHCFAAYITSLLSSQDLKQQILDKSEEECPPTITAEMLERLQATTGREDSIRSLQGLTQKEVSLSIDLKNLHDFSTSI